MKFSIILLDTVNLCGSLQDIKRLLQYVYINKEIKHWGPCERGNDALSFHQEPVLSTFVEMLNRE